MSLWPPSKPKPPSPLMGAAPPSDMMTIPVDVYASMRQAYERMRQPEGSHEDRQRFIKEYVLRRAHEFRRGHEQEDAWDAILTARSIYKIMQEAVWAEERKRQEDHNKAMQEMAQQVLSQGYSKHAGMTGPYPQPGAQTSRLPPLKTKL